MKIRQMKKTSILAIFLMIGQAADALPPADKLAIYYQSALSDPNLANAARYTVGALQEAAQLKLSDPLQKKKYEDVQKLAESTYKKCKAEHKYDLAISIAQQGIATEEAVNGKDSPGLLKYLFFMENTIATRDSRERPNQVFQNTGPYCQRALDIGEKLPPLNKQELYGQQHQYGFLLTAIIKDYMHTLKTAHREQELAALQRRVDKMPVFSDGGAAK